MREPTQKQIENYNFFKSELNYFGLPKFLEYLNNIEKLEDKTKINKFIKSLPKFKYGIQIAEYLKNLAEIIKNKRGA